MNFVTTYESFPRINDTSTCDFITKQATYKNKSFKVVASLTGFFIASTIAVRLFYQAQGIKDEYDINCNDASKLSNRCQKLENTLDEYVLGLIAFSSIAAFAILIAAYNCLKREP